MNASMKNLLFNQFRKDSNRTMFHFFCDYLSRLAHETNFNFNKNYHSLKVNVGNSV